METQRMDRKRKLDYESATAVGLSLCEMFNRPQHERNEGWDVLHPILENEVLQSKIPTNDAALSHLVRWFRIIAHDSEKLRVFRQWVLPSPDIVKQELSSECISKSVSSNVITSNVSSSTSSSNVSPSAASASSTSLAALLSDVLSKKNASTVNVACEDALTTSSSSTGSFIPDSNIEYSKTITNGSTSNGSSNVQQQTLLHQLLQQNQQQIELLQQLQKQPSKNSTNAQVSLFPRVGCPNTLLTVSLKGGCWHSRTTRCDCTVSFTASDGTITTTQRIPGGSDGDFLFMVPHIKAPGASLSSTAPMVVHLKLCTSPNMPIMCLEPFLYSRERTLHVSGSDEDSEEMVDEAAADDDSEGGSPPPPPQALPPHDIPHTACPTPKQMMSIRERMLEHVQQRAGTRASVRMTVLQQPSVRVVWKNRRLDTPFKLKVECLAESPSNGSAFGALTPSKLVILAVIADHKGRLQIDAAENFTEDCSSQGLAHFSNLRMTKGTWGKEWTITFAAVVKSTLNHPVVVGVSTSCPIVVKTRKNPQIRHNKQDPSPSSSPNSERKSDEPLFRAKRHRVEDLLDGPDSPQRPSHSEDMASLLAAAEMKQKEQEGGSGGAPISSLVNKPGSSANEQQQQSSFANIQNLMTHLEEIRSKRQISLGIIDQPVPKRDSKVLVVKKGKPFRVPFQVQMHSTAERHNPQQYVCVAVVRNDKGEEVAVRNNEVPFDWRGVACFAGLMVMKGTWGKIVHLTFEARFATRRADKEAPWTSQRMLVVSESQPTQLMCYTKDKKTPSTL